ncbi:hypothetical protein PPNSA23_33990 [Phyllobacterium phragmitis]|uniref:Uncharacterized protein n=1 Tax=Phyllobacterium phragmitis TaxID=2670329 RepID=A0ABQ0H3H6_9HYPH
MPALSEAGKTIERLNGCLIRPRSVRIRKAAPEFGREDRTVHEAAVEFGADFGFVHPVGADEDDLLAAVAQIGSR